MAFSSGTFSLYTPGNPVVTGTTIASTWANNTLSDIATGLSTCVLKDGTQTITANIPMSSFKFTGLAAGTTAGDSIRYEQLLPVATQADQETGTSTTAPVTPGRQQYHQSAAKMWVNFTNSGTPTIATSYNVTSLTDNGAGDTTVNMTTAFSAGTYPVVGSANSAGDWVQTTPAVAPRIQTRLTATNALNDANCSVVAFGDL